MPFMSPSTLHLVQNALDGNAMILINIGLALFAIVTSLRSTWTLVYNFAEKSCLTTVHIKEEDPLYSDVILWMNDHIFKHQHFRSTLAATINQSDSCNYPDDHQPTNRGQSIKFQPFEGSRLFRFDRKWILFSHSAPSSQGIFPDPQGQDKLRLKLQCLSLSLSPLRCFLAEASRYSLKTSKSNVTIYRTLANAYDVVRWVRITSRPSRDMSTVILETAMKERILRDIAEYLHPRAKQWYANHGIPYRRGYLFSGPPGTGKTSLASAIAGAFGLDIYVLSLLDSNVSESQFMRLFSEVPSRCVVLLEDIDAAGVSLARGAMAKTQSTVSQKKGETQSVDQPQVSAPASTISLSGLLNAIDGVSSQEGRILIMTTNAPQVLDRALIRPGRVDLHIQFDLPSREELKGLFLSMFSDRIGEVTEKEDAKSESNSLEELAVKFAGKLPERKLSLADVQGFLLQYKKRPEEACVRVTDWVTEVVSDGDSEGLLV